jgi:hypothetical protein
MTWYLAGLGHRPWNDVRDVCQGMTCAWADYNGYHFVKDGDALPSPLPTHISGRSLGVVT